MKKDGKIAIEKANLLINYGVDLDAIKPYVVTDVKKHLDETQIELEIPGLRRYTHNAPLIWLDKEGTPIFCGTLNRDIINPKSWSEVVECFQLSEKQLRDVEKEKAAQPKKKTKKNNSTKNIS